jgi:hypothetical protein
MGYYPHNYFHVLVISVFDSSDILLRKRRCLLYRRKRGGIFYIEDTETREQESAGTPSTGNKP